MTEEKKFYEDVLAALDKHDREEGVLLEEIRDDVKATFEFVSGVDRTVRTNFTKLEARMDSLEENQKQMLEDNQDFLEKFRKNDKRYDALEERVSCLELRDEDIGRYHREE